MEFFACDSFVYVGFSRNSDALFRFGRNIRLLLGPIHDIGHRTKDKGHRAPNHDNFLTKYSPSESCLHDNFPSTPHRSASQKRHVRRQFGDFSLSRVVTSFDSSYFPQISLSLSEILFLSVDSLSFSLALGSWLLPPDRQRPPNAIIARGHIGKTKQKNARKRALAKRDSLEEGK